MGDQTGAKQGTMRTYLQDASDPGAKLLPNVWVDRILYVTARPSGSKRRTRTHGHKRSSRVVINAPSVVAAARQS